MLKILKYAKDLSRAHDPETKIVIFSELFIKVFYFVL